MADIELVIKIPKEEYRNICLMSKDGIGMALYDWIASGTTLPKGHGDLIDKSEAIISLFDYYNGKKTVGQCIDDVQTIIEADKEDKNE